MKNNIDTKSEDHIAPQIGLQFLDPDNWFRDKASYNVGDPEDTQKISVQGQFDDQECCQDIQTAATRASSNLMVVELGSNSSENSQEHQAESFSELDQRLTNENYGSQVTSLAGGNDKELVNYNKGLIQNTKSKKIKGKNRYPDIFLPRFKWKIKRELQKQNPHRKIIMKDLTSLPGLSDPSMKSMIQLLKSENLLQSGIAASFLAEQYTSSNQILLDAIFPLQIQSGDLRKTKIEKKSTQDFNRFFSSYEIISKLIGSEDIDKKDLNFQNCRHYNIVTDTVYDKFDVNK